MNRGARCLLVLGSLLAISGSVVAREWKSADGRGSFEAEFLAAKDDQVMLKTADNRTAAYPLAAFSKPDQTFAKDAQAIAEAAAKDGPRAFQITQIVEGGWLCRMASAEDAQKAQPRVFIGEVFFCLATDPSKGARRQVFDKQPLFAAVVHFMKPPEGMAIPATEVAWHSGFQVIGQILGHFGHLDFLLAEFATLCAVGWVLVTTRLRTGRLWAGIGLHAGWVFGLKYFSSLTRGSKELRAGEWLPWIGTNLKIGLVPLVVVVLTGGLVLWLARRWSAGPLVEHSKKESARKAPQDQPLAPP